MHDPVYEEVFQGHTIKIYHDPDTDSLREWFNFGMLICWHLSYRRGDGYQYGNPEAFLRNRTGISDQRDLAMDQLRDRAERKSVLLPVYLYNRSGLAINTIGFHCPWDSGQVGYVVVTLEAVRTEFGVKRVNKAQREKAEDVLRGETVSYDAYLGGRILAKSSSGTARRRMLARVLSPTMRQAACLRRGTLWQYRRWANLAIPRPP